MRQLRKAPAFTLIAIFTLALGIGATTAIFSLLDAVVLRPLPFAHPERIVNLFMTDRGELRSMSAGNFLAYRERTRSLASLSALSICGPTALLASWLPARRAARVEPTRALAP
jgi:hypothetical protein